MCKAPFLFSKMPGSDSVPKSCLWSSCGFEDGNKNSCTIPNTSLFPLVRTEGMPLESVTLKIRLLYESQCSDTIVIKNPNK